MKEPIWQPRAIEEESFRRIDKTVGSETIKRFSQLEWPVVRRIIHTTADCQFADLTRISHGAVEAGINALLNGEPVVTDTRMLEAGISTGRLDQLGVKVHCFINDPWVRDEAKRISITRSALSMDRAAGLLDGQGIVAIGNAPTALLRLIYLLKEGKVRPSLIVGMPVGFVSAAESKDLLVDCNCSFITAVGPKGGSPVAASVINALAIMALQRKGN